MRFAGPKLAALNAGALVAALGLGAGLAGLEPSPASSSPTPTPGAALADATGQRVAIRAYERIVSASTIADQVLVEILPRRRLLAVTAHTHRNSPTPWRYEGLGALEAADDVEAILRLRPDLVVVSNVMESRRVARLREAGATVFDLGPMEGLASLLEDVRALSTLVAVPERGEALAGRLTRRYRNIADGHFVGAGIYLGVVGGQLYGGAAGTNYHDVLAGAGLRDLAADRGLRGWPVLTSEEVLALDPPWVVTNAGQERALCGRPGLEALAACRGGRVVGIDERYLGDPGFGLVEAAELLHERLTGAL